VLGMNWAIPWAPAGERANGLLFDSLFAPIPVGVEWRRDPPEVDEIGPAAAATAGGHDPRARSRECPHRTG
jgi:hypothetical protein